MVSVFRLCYGGRGRQAGERTTALTRLSHELALGKIIDAHMAKEHVSMDELQRALREHGVASCHDLALAVLEVDGSISCLKYDDLNPNANNHMARRKILQKHQ